ncbi:MAG: cytochrome c biogenesis protein CcdA [Ilumatobacteraceae bacterium]
MIALDGYFAYSFSLGLAAAVNPCGFVMLPAYLMYFLGLEGTRPGGGQRASLVRALRVSAATSAGAVSVFVVVGTVSRLFTSVIEDNVKYAGFVIGIALIILGCFLLAGWKPPFALPQIGAGAERQQTIRSMFGFGVAYAVASIGCTIGLLVSAVFGTFSKGFVSGVVAITLYGVGMGLIVTALTVTLAFASGGLLLGLRRLMQYMDRVAALFVMATGFYLTWYWYTGISNRTESDGLTSRVGGWSESLVDLFNRVGVWTLLVIFLVPVVAAIAFVTISRRREHPQVDG